MKNLRILIFLSPLAFLGSCDYVKEPNISGGATNCISTDSFPAPAATQRNVLLEDFTGHKCPNCPGASYSARQLQTTLASQGKELIIVGIHAGSPLADPDPAGSGSFETDFRTTAGNTFYSTFGMSYVPIGLIDRVPFNGSVLIDTPDWSTVINNEFTKPLEVDLQMIARVDTNARLADIYVKSEFLTSKSGSFSLVIYTLEDSIVDWQINGANGDPDYPLNSNISNFMHRHVLRDNVTPVWGSAVVNGSVAAGEKFTNCFTDYSISTNWKMKHVYFVAYIYDESNKEILQAIEMHPQF